MEIRCRAGLSQLKSVQIVGCNAETLVTFRQFQADGGFAIPTTDLAAYNALLEADSTGLLMHENKTQVLHGLWKSTRVQDAGAEVGPGLTHRGNTKEPPSLQFTIAIS